MKIKRFFAKDIRAALDEIKVTLGPDAIIMSNKNVEGGVEIVAAIDEDNNAVVKKPSAPAVSEQATQSPVAAANAAQSSQSGDNSWDTTNRFEREFNDDQVSLSGFQQRLIKQQAQNAVSELTPIQPEMAEPTVPVNANNIPDELPAWAQSLNEPVQQAAVQNHQAHGLEQFNASTESPVIEELRQEMASMRQLLQHQVSSLMTQDASRRDPVRHLISNELIRLGFDANVAQQLLVNIPANSDIEQAKATLATTMFERVASTRNDVLEQGGVVALLGPTGVGKTTTVAKLAARYAMRFGQENVAMITTDSYRIGAYEQLNTYGKIMGCPVTVAKDAQQLADAIYQYRTKRLVLIDTAGMGQRDIRLNEQLTTLMNSSHVAIRSYLVLPATAQRQVLEDAITQFRKIPLTGAIVTKMDEAISASEILSVAIGNALPIGYLTNGQRVPEDIGVADIKKLIDSVVEHIGENADNDSQDIARFNR
ncbi:flagellar biosynthesis protein FlhF [Psychrobium sp. MM17-31]|uniref:flagellar biosynthesis protein FlhF n=1 Tax=Psychrobium sp. MM17-31 TaxID=2917758 RepID=UPI001EF5238D|nr:flagellar biosynthesis protein FlhF [Psychrobium sp. MM17-31]MCG7530077.1 flagellar biosynthesis protein FlhF [Psychrobium sp. MM17-31]